MCEYVCVFVKVNSAPSGLCKLPWLQMTPPDVTPQQRPPGIVWPISLINPGVFVPSHKCDIINIIHLCRRCFLMHVVTNKTNRSKWWTKRSERRKHCARAGCSRVANSPGMAGIVPELTNGVPCPGRGSFCPGNVKINCRAWIYGCSLMNVLYFVSYLSVTRDLTWLECDVND